MNANAKYADDVHEGDVFTTAARTLTETDIVSFAALTGDWNPIHTDVESARLTSYGERVVHGFLALTYAIGLLDRAGYFSGTAIANLGVSDWTFAAPLFIGDTIRLRVTIGAVRITKDGERGIVERKMEILNQRGDVVQRGTIPIMLRRRASDETAEETQ